MSSISDDELVRRFPGFVVTADNSAFYRGWLDRELVLNRCADCGHWDAEHHPICPECWSSAMEPRAVSGRGTVHLLFWLEQGPAPTGTAASGPHPVATIELEEQRGLRYTSTVLDVARDELAIGDAVELAWITREGEPFPVFKRVATTTGGNEQQRPGRASLVQGHTS